MSFDIDRAMRLGPVIPVATVDDASCAPDLAGALAEGGIGVLEITLRTPAALGAIRAVVESGSSVIVGAGTVTRADQVKEAEQAGARFVVSPGLSESVVRAAEDARLPILPGVATASDIMRGRDLGLSRFKLFPAGALGGPALVAALAPVFPDAAFCPTGGVDLQNAPAYLAYEAVPCVGGSWLTTKALLAERAWERIAQLAAEASQLAPR